MPVRMTLASTLPQVLERTERPLAGMWVVSASPLIAEIAAGSGLDLLLIDGEHSANTLASIQLQLQAAAAYPVTPLVRECMSAPPWLSASTTSPVAACTSCGPPRNRKPLPRTITTSSHSAGM